jgi:transcriptional regulator with XRE-family HTH domain
MAMASKIQIGKRITTLREECGLTQAEFAMCKCEGSRKIQELMSTGMEK